MDIEVAREEAVLIIMMGDEGFNNSFSSVATAKNESY